ncbi:MULTISPECIES: hypothetical protein [Sorangium]|uniref:Uncharacterized protein n=1 Tax=Sorangium cellulosum TaxID=56 RepID=A0A4P2QSJ0_SORCE|nr:MULTISPECIES: hypothetical protein [Sorangium]AUX33192.1 uncharacterized protein SOCE836_053460 [Sorangium cellulosum]AUX33249.1 uncharacterized protein SOCE836_054030 [Sorangium cellulosum]WCQ92568.1 hypothetical protein NQZ70_05309 [Sorangium sp. Soce836]
MSKSVHRAPRGAKESVRPEEPTAAQMAFFDEVRAAARELERRACRLTHSRRGSPEQIATVYLLDVLRTTLRYVEAARAEGRPLELRHPGGWVTCYLAVGEPPAKVIDMRAYVERRRHR